MLRRHSSRRDICPFRHLKKKAFTKKAKIPRNTRKKTHTTKKSCKAQKQKSLLQRLLPSCLPQKKSYVQGKISRQNQSPLAQSSTNEETKPTISSTSHHIPHICPEQISTSADPVEYPSPLDELEYLDTSLEDGQQVLETARNDLKIAQKQYKEARQEKTIILTSLLRLQRQQVLARDLYDSNRVAENSRNLRVLTAKAEQSAHLLVSLSHEAHTLHYFILRKVESQQILIYKDATEKLSSIGLAKTAAKDSSEEDPHIDHVSNVVSPFLIDSEESVHIANDTIQDLRKVQIEASKQIGTLWQEGLVDLSDNILQIWTSIDTVINAHNDFIRRELERKYQVLASLEANLQEHYHQQCDQIYRISTEFTNTATHKEVFPDSILTDLEQKLLKIKSWVETEDRRLLRQMECQSDQIETLRTYIPDANKIAVIPISLMYNHDFEKNILTIKEERLAHLRKDRSRLTYALFELQSAKLKIEYKKKLEAVSFGFGEWTYEVLPKVRDHEKGRAAAHILRGQISNHLSSTRSLDDLKTDLGEISFRYDHNSMQLTEYGEAATQNGAIRRANFFKATFLVNEFKSSTMYTRTLCEELNQVENDLLRAWTIKAVSDMDQFMKEFDDDQMSRTEERNSYNFEDARFQEIQTQRQEIISKFDVDLEQLEAMIKQANKEVQMIDKTRPDAFLYSERAKRLQFQLGVERAHYNMLEFLLMKRRGPIQTVFRRHQHQSPLITPRSLERALKFKSLRSFRDIVFGHKLALYLVKTNALPNFTRSEEEQLRDLLSYNLYGNLLQLSLSDGQVLLADRIIASAKEHKLMSGDRAFGLRNDLKLKHYIDDGFQEMKIVIGNLYENFDGRFSVVESQLPSIAESVKRMKDSIKRRRRTSLWASIVKLGLCAIPLAGPVAAAGVELATEAISNLLFSEVPSEIVSELASAIGEKAFDCLQEKNLEDLSSSQRENLAAAQLGRLSLTQNFRSRLDSPEREKYVKCIEFAWGASMSDIEVKVNSAFKELLDNSDPSAFNVSEDALVGIWESTTSTSFYKNRIEEPERLALVEHTE